MHPHPPPLTYTLGGGTGENLAQPGQARDGAAVSSGNQVVAVSTVV